VVLVLDEPSWSPTGPSPPSAAPPISTGSGTDRPADLRVRRAGCPPRICPTRPSELSRSACSTWATVIRRARGTFRPHRSGHPPRGAAPARRRGTRCGRGPLLAHPQRV